MKQTFLGTTGDIKTLETHFARMAEKGWMIEKVGMLFHTYRRIESCTKKFFVDLLPQITAFDYPENDDAQSYRRLCEESGWTFISAYKQIHVFCAEEDNIEPIPSECIPIHTDNKIQAQIYLKAAKKELKIFIFVMVLTALLLPLLILGKILLDDFIIQLIGEIIFLVGFSWLFWHAVIQYKRIKKCAKLDLPLPPVNYWLVRVRGTVTLIICFVYLILMFLPIFSDIISNIAPPGTLIWVLGVPVIMVGSIIWLIRQINTKRRKRKTNIILTIFTIIVVTVISLFLIVFGMVFFKFNIPTAPIEDFPVITLHEFGIGLYSEPDEITAEVRSSVPALINYFYEERSEFAFVKTKVIKSNIKAVSQLFYNTMSERFYNHFNENTDWHITVLDSEKAAVWGADEGYYIVCHCGRTINLLLLKENAILEFSFQGRDNETNTARKLIRDFWEK